MTYGTDITREHTPLEGGMEKYCSLDSDIRAIGIEALRTQRDRGVTRKIIGVMANGDKVPAQRDPWPIRDGNRVVGSITSITWSPRLECNVGLGMVETTSTSIGTTLTLDAPDAPRTATVCQVPFEGASQR